MEHGDPVGKRDRLHLIVGDEDHRALERLVEALEVEQHLEAQVPVHMAQHLVEYERRGLADERTR